MRLRSTNIEAPTLWSVRHPKDPKAVIAAPRDISNVEQRWFVRAHTNVGGAYATDLLPQAPLQWIMKGSVTGTRVPKPGRPGRRRAICTARGLLQGVRLRSLFHGNPDSLSDYRPGAVCSGKRPAR